MEITKLTALELGSKIRSGEIGVIEAVTAQIDRIKKEDGKYNSYVTLMEEQALVRAKIVQSEILAGGYQGSPLAGVPMAVKDNICTKGTRTACSSKMLSDFIPPYDAEVIERLKRAGAVIVGKLNMDEFAMGSTSETSYFGAVKNPWNTAHVSGGSSGGSAAAAAAEEAFYTLGSDTGGSIRQPSAFCGVTGLKPTYGTISRYGLVAYASSLDQIGPIGRNISDCTAALEILAGYDPKDSTSMKRVDYNFSSALIDDVKGMRIGIPKSYLGNGLESEIKASIEAAARVLESKGAVVELFDLDMMDYAIPAYYIIASAEASSNLSRYDGVKYGYRAGDFEGLEELYRKTRSEGFGMEVKRRMMIGAFVLSSGYYDAYYNKALQVKGMIKRSFDRAFEKYDILLGPTAPTTAMKLGENLSDPLKMYLGDIYTVSVNLAGLPAVSIPCGTDEKGLPIGLQFIGRPFGEKQIIRAAYSYECTRTYESPRTYECPITKKGGSL